ncbi:hypothetical protein B0B52_09140 [Polaromonas sp. A23]|nr:hypothetical protein B0B52_09140 [Polaromonas sp. A23]
MSYLVRMVTPMKREFGRSLDVHQFLHDLPYATEVVQEALKSKDERLRSYAAYMETKVLGPRNSSASVLKKASAAKPAQPAVGAPHEKEIELSDDLRAQAIARYRSGLR